jgi:serine/threonine protein phosphatase PrpC
MTDKPATIRLGFWDEAAKLLSDPLWICVAAVLVALIALAAIRLAGRKRRKGARPLPAIANIHGIGKRDSQQDAFAVSSFSDDRLCAEKGVLAVLADGMGGLSHGAEISRIVVKTMMEGFADCSRLSETPQEELMGLVRLADQKVAGFLAEHAVERGGSTLIAVLIKDGQMDYISVGDSRLCLVRDGAISTLNKVHTYGAELDELAKKGIYPQEYAAFHPNRGALTSFIGIKDLKKIDASESSINLQKGDRLILMSDGVFNTLGDEEILSCMKQDVYASAQCLDQLMLDHNDEEQDNYTAILIEHP